MKRISVLLALIALIALSSITDAHAGGLFLGAKKSSEVIVFPLHDALDSAGIPGKPDSAHVLTYSDNLTALAYTDRSTTYPFSDASLDTSKIYGDTTYWFNDVISTVDGTAGNYLLTICVKLWYKKLATETLATVQVIGDSLNTALFATMPAIRDTVNAILDTLQDGSGGHIVQLSTAALASVGNRAADSTWGKSFTTSFAAGSMGDTLNNYSPLRAIAKTIFDSTATVVTVSRASADSTWGKAFGTAFTVGSMGDSLNNASYVTGSGGGGGGAVSSADAGKIADSVWSKSWGGSFPNGSMGDSLNNFTPLRGSAKSIFDSSASVITISKASADSVWNKSFGATFPGGSMGDSANNSSWMQGIGSNAITSSTLATSAADEIADEVWDEDTTSHNLAATFGHVNNGKNWASPSIVADTFWNKNFFTPFASGSMGDSLNNSSYVGSGTGGPDSTKVARWVWNTPRLNHLISGTFGRNLDAQVSGLASGAGAYSRTIVVLDTSLDVTVNSASVALRPLNQSGLVSIATTDAAGRVFFNLDSDSFLVITNGPGLMFTVYDTIVVSGGGTDSVFGYRFNPAAPALTGICRVWGYLVQVDGTPEEETQIDVLLPRGVSRAGSVVVSPFSVSTTSDATGYFVLDLIWSSALQPANTEYEIAISRSDGTILRKRFLVPNQSTWQFSW